MSPVRRSTRAAMAARRGSRAALLGAALLGAALLGVAMLGVAMLAACSDVGAGSGWKSREDALLGVGGWSVPSSPGLTLDEAVRQLIRELLGDSVPIEVRLGQPTEPPSIANVSINGGPSLPTYWTRWVMVQAGDGFEMTETEATLSPGRSSELTDAERARWIAENVSAATLFVRDGSSIYSRKISRAELRAGRAQLGPRSGATVALLVASDASGRVTALLSGFRTVP